MITWTDRGKVSLKGEEISTYTPIVAVLRGNNSLNEEDCSVQQHGGLTLAKHKTA